MSNAHPAGPLPAPMAIFQHELRLKPPAKHDVLDGPRGGVPRAGPRPRGIDLRTVSPHLGPARPTGPVAGPPFCTGTRAENAHSTHVAPPAGPGTPSPVKLAPAGVRESRATRKYDVSLPTSADLEGLDLAAKLRLLALKEMAVVELRDALAALQDRLHASERDLQSLRTVVQRSLYRQLQNGAPAAQPPRNAAQSRPGPAPGNQARVPPGGGDSRPSFRGPSSAAAPHKGPATRPARASTGSRRNSQGGPPPGAQNGAAGDRLLKLWTNLARPISFIQSLDHMLLLEFERSMGDGTLPARPTGRGKAPPEAPELDGPGQSPWHVAEPRSWAASHDESADDMFQAVSTSLWAFVNDMKTSMVSTLAADPAQAPECGSPRRLSWTGSPSRASLEPAAAALSGPVLGASLHEHSDPESCADLLELSDSDDEQVDLSMYSAMRKQEKPEAT